MNNRKGMILAEVMVMAVILSFLAVTMLHLALGKHFTVNRVGETVNKKELGQAAVAEAFSRWHALGYCTGGDSVGGCSGAGPPGVSCQCTYLIGGKNVTVTVTPSSSPCGAGTTAPCHQVTVNVPD